MSLEPCSLGKVHVTATVDNWEHLCLQVWEDRQTALELFDCLRVCLTLCEIPRYTEYELELADNTTGASPDSRSLQY